MSVRINPARHHITAGCIQLMIAFQIRPDGDDLVMLDENVRLVRAVAVTMVPFLMTLDIRKNPPAGQEKTMDMDMNCTIRSASTASRANPLRERQRAEHGTITAQRAGLNVRSARNRARPCADVPRLPNAGELEKFGRDILTQPV